MSRFFFAALMVLAFAALGAGPASRPTPPSQQIEELRSEIAILRAENAELRARLLKLQGVDPGAGAKTPDADSKPFTSVEQILGTIPKELQPQKGAWDTFSLPKANEWLKENVVGKELECSFTLRTIDVTPIMDRDDKDKIATWYTNITVGHDSLDFKGIEMDVLLRSPPRTTNEDATNDSLGMPVGEAFARLAKTWKPGDRIVLKGKIQTFHIGKNCVFSFEEARPIRVGKKNVAP